MDNWLLVLGLLVSGVATLGMFVGTATGDMTMFVGASMTVILMVGAMEVGNDGS